MSRIFSNIVLILIIAFVGAIVPLDLKLFDFNLKLPNLSTEEPQVPAQTDTPIKLTLLDENVLKKHFYNPKTLSFVFQLNQTLPKNFKEEFSNSLSASFSFANGDKLKKENSSFSKNIAQAFLISCKENKLTLTLPHSEIKKLSSGHYVLSLKTDFFENQHIQASFTQTKSCLYMPSEQNEPVGKRFVTLYFSSPDHKHLVPVSRLTRLTKNRIRSTLNALRDGPKENSALIKTVPYIPSAWFSSNIGTLRLEMSSRRNAPFVKTSASTNQMFSSLIKTMSSLDGVKNLQFLVDKKSDVVLHDFNLKTIYEKDLQPKAYMGWHSETNRLYLVPKTISSSEVSDIVSFLKSTQDGLFSPLPPCVKLIDSQIENGQLKITFSSELAHAYPHQDICTVFMMDALCQSLLSLPQVESLWISIDKSNLSELGGVPLNQPYIPSLYINPEKILN